MLGPMDIIVGGDLKIVPHELGAKDGGVQQDDEQEHDAAGLHEQAPPYAIDGGRRERGRRDRPGRHAN